MQKKGLKLQKMAKSMQKANGDGVVSWNVARSASGSGEVNDSLYVVWL